MKEILGRAPRSHFFSFEFVGGSRREGQEVGETSPETSEPAMPDYTGPVDVAAPTTEPFVNQF